MTEAEDVARAMEQIEPLIDSALDLMEVRAITMPILARLVREGQIRCLEELLTQEWVTREAGLERRSVSSSTIHFRIAALRREG